MGRSAVAHATETIEKGAITFLYRPRVEEHHPGGLDDIQRVLLLLAPHRGAFQRLIAVGRKRLPRSARRDRFWGFVDLVLTGYDMNAALGAHVYGTRTRGLRHLPAARRFARGAYEIVTHDHHSHLRWQIDRIVDDDPISHESVVEEEADYIVTVANPDPTAWGLVETPDLQSDLFDDLELHVTIPTPFPAGLQERFEGRRFVQLDTTAWLNHPGAELVLIGSGEPLPSRP